MTDSTPSLPTTKIESRLREDMSRQIDAWIAAQPEPRPTRSEAIRCLLAEALAKEADARSSGKDAPQAISDETAPPEIPPNDSGPYDGSPYDGAACEVSQASVTNPHHVVSSFDEKDSGHDVVHPFFRETDRVHRATLFELIDP
jgi:Arc/MetJ-type ribon-helix-helix transcriptional regulator